MSFFLVADGCDFTSMDRELFAATPAQNAQGHVSATITTVVAKTESMRFWLLTATAENDTSQELFEVTQDQVIAGCAYSETLLGKVVKACAMNCANLTVWYANDRVDGNGQIDIYEDAEEFISALIVRMFEDREFGFMRLCLHAKSMSEV